MVELGALGGADGTIAADFRWGKYVPRGGVVVDVGGGLGDMLAQIMVAGTGGQVKHGVVFDLPSVTDRSRAVWDAAAAAATEAGAVPAVTSALSRSPPGVRRAALASRVTFLPGSFFDASSVPSAAGLARAHAVDAAAAEAVDACIAPPVAYAMRDILHDWPDVDVSRMLAALASAMRAPPTRATSTEDFASGNGPPRTCLSDRIMLIVRLVVPGASFVESHGTLDADWHMLANFGTTAGERTLEQYKALIAGAGLKLESVAPLRGMYSILVVKKA